MINNFTLSGFLSPSNNSLEGSLSYKQQQFSNKLSSVDKINGKLINTILYGYSAYELAVKQGYKGTLEEWIASLKGAEVQLRQNDGDIEWKYSNEQEWRFLLNISTVSDYEILSNKPSINGITLSGDLDLNKEYIGNDEILSNAEIEELLK